MFEKVEKQLLTLLKESINNCFKDSPQASSLHNLLDSIILEIPKEKEFGDLSCSIALRLASLLKKNPKEVASMIVAALEGLAARRGSSRLIKNVEVKGAGFINIFLKEEAFCDLLVDVNRQGETFGRFAFGKGRRILLEFVSANPTGALSVAHARQAAVGDALATLTAIA